MKYIHKNNDGQAIIEFIICAPLLILFIFSIIHVSNLLIAKERTIVSARYCAWHLLRNDEKENILEEKISKYFFNQQKNVSVQTNEKGPEIENLFQTTMDTYLNIFENQSRLLHVKIVNPVFYPFSKTPLVLTEENYIKGNSWNGYDIDIHDIQDAIIHMIKHPLDFLL